MSDYLDVNGTSYCSTHAEAQYPGLWMYARQEELASQKLGVCHTRSNTNECRMCQEQEKAARSFVPDNPDINGWTDVWTTCAIVVGATLAREYSPHTWGEDSAKALRRRCYQILGYYGIKVSDYKEQVRGLIERAINETDDEKWPF